MILPYFATLLVSVGFADGKITCFAEKPGEFCQGDFCVFRFGSKPIYTHCYNILAGPLRSLRNATICRLIGGYQGMVRECVCESNKCNNPDNFYAAGDIKEGNVKCPLTGAGPDASCMGDICTFVENTMGEKMVENSTTCQVFDHKYTNPNFPTEAVESTRGTSGCITLIFENSEERRCFCREQHCDGKFGNERRAEMPRISCKTGVSSSCKGKGCYIKVRTRTNTIVKGCYDLSSTLSISPICSYYRGITECFCNTTDCNAGLDTAVRSVSSVPGRGLEDDLLSRRVNVLH